MIDALALIVVGLSALYWLTSGAVPGCEACLEPGEPIAGLALGALTAAAFVLMRRRKHNPSEPSRPAVRDLIAYSEVLHQQCQAARHDAVKATAAMAASGARIDEACRELDARLDAAEQAVNGLTATMQAQASLDASNAAGIQGLWRIHSDRNSGERHLIAVLSGDLQAVQQAATAVRHVCHEIRLVSLNAAIYAIRAGQVGRPFAAVVAAIKDLATSIDRVAEQTCTHSDHLVSALQDRVSECSDAGAQRQRADELQRLLTHWHESSAAVAAAEQALRESLLDFRHSHTALSRNASQVSALMAGVSKPLARLEETESSLAELTCRLRELELMCPSAD